MSDEERELMAMLLAAVVLLDGGGYNEAFKSELMNVAQRAGFVDEHGRPSHQGKPVP